MARRARARFWVRWATRDARRHVWQVASIALLIALGTGMYTAMSSMSRWRVHSADASYAQLRMHDLRASLAEASYVPAGSLERAVRGADGVAVAEERLVVATQVDASVPGQDIVVPGRVVGAPVAPEVDRTAVEHGRRLVRGDEGAARVLLERNFAAHYGLPAAGSLRLAGGRTVGYVGQAKAPEYFVVTAPGADFGAESSFAVLFTSLETAQRLAGRAGEVNEVVVRARPGVTPARLERAVAAAVSSALPGVGVTFTQQRDEPAHRLIYEDAKNDQQMLDIFAYLLLGAATFAAFNLISRTVEAQRREIGIGMALGVRPRRLALRPMLLGGEIALAGVALGIPIGLLANSWLGDVLRTWFPLPVIETTFEPDVFVAGAALGILLPLLATALPVRRAVRVAPVEAIRVGARSGTTSGMASLAKHVRMPGGSFGNMPIRNVLRAPRRTALTALGVGAVVAIVVALSAVIDSFDATLDAAQAETLGGVPGRITVDLAAPQPGASPAVRAVQRSPAVGRSQASLRVPVKLSSPAASFNASLEFVAPDAALWRPRAERGAISRDAGGIVIADIAARDLGVDVGDRVAVELPVPGARGVYALRTTRLRVDAIHPSPFRFVAYASPAGARALGLGGVVNRVSVTPAPGADEIAVKRALLSVPGVTAVQSATASTDAVDKRMDQFGEVLVVTVGVAMAMALLMAYNASAINADERARENATMFAFGVPVQRVVALGVSEALLVGLLATALGFLAGYGLLRWMVYSSFPHTMPDVGMLIAIDPVTVVSALVAGTVAVALAPLLTRRRLRRTDIPTTLRVVE